MSTYKLSKFCLQYGLKRNIECLAQVERFYNDKEFISFYLCQGYSLKDIQYHIEVCYNYNFGYKNFYRKYSDLANKIKERRKAKQKKKIQKFKKNYEYLKKRICQKGYCQFIRGAEHLKRNNEISQINLCKAIIYHLYFIEKRSAIISRIKSKYNKLGSILFIKF